MIYIQLNSINDQKMTQTFRWKTFLEITVNQNFSDFVQKFVLQLQILFFTLRNCFIFYIWNNGLNPFMRTLLLMFIWFSGTHWTVKAKLY